MKAEKLMNAIGNINDRHIAEFAVIRQKKHKTLWFKAALAAACFCIILSAALIIPAFIPISNVTGTEDKQNAESDFSYDLILQMPKSYVGAADRIIYQSLDEFKKESSSIGALASVECIDTKFYVTIDNHNGDIYVSGKAVSKCKVTSISETFNNYDVKVGSIVEITQDCYILPINEDDCLDMYESFGAKFQRDLSGEIIGMEIDDGDYLLNYKEGVEYELRIFQDALPLEEGKGYTGAICSNEPVTWMDYIAPIEDSPRYEDFNTGTTDINIAKEIRDEVLN